MLSKTIAAAVQGIDATMVTIETTLDWGNQVVIVGLPDTALRSVLRLHPPRILR